MVAMWPFTRQSRTSTVSAPILLTNTLSGTKDAFAPLKAGTASLYTCGPTVYGRAHIGNLRAYVFSDTLACTLKQAGYRVRRVINITDVGHLVGDADEGEDKLAVAARTEGVRPEAVASQYTEAFLSDIAALNLPVSDILFPRATDYIKEQIAMNEVLEQKGYAYRISDGLYFDTSRFEGYGKLGGVADVELQEGARVAINTEKRNPQDFALWRKAGPRDLQKWNSPWGEGNPGWSIECSAMAKALLGTEIDIHTGGMDHIAVHHNNEIAQSEGANGRPLARYWLHNAFLTIEGEKISKSLGNTFTLDDIIDREFHPLSLRYLLLQAHYRTPLSFSFAALSASDEALKRLWRIALHIQEEAKGKAAHSEYAARLIAYVRDDLGTPQALATLWEALKDDSLSPEQQLGVLSVADELFGISLLAPPQEFLPLSGNAVPQDVQNLLNEREEARQKKDFARADELRTHIANRGYLVEDSPSGPLLTKSRK